MNISGIFSPEIEMTIISKGKKKIATRTEGEKLMNIPSAGAEYKIRKIGGGGRKPRKLVIYII